MFCVDYQITYTPAVSSGADAGWGVSPYLCPSGHMPDWCIELHIPLIPVADGHPFATQSISFPIKYFQVFLASIPKNSMAEFVWLQRVHVHR